MKIGSVIKGPWLIKKKAMDESQPKWLLMLGFQPKKQYAYKSVHMYYIIFNLTVTALAFPVLIRFVNSDSCDLDFMRAQSLTT